MSPLSVSVSVCLPVSVSVVLIDTTHAHLHVHARQPLSILVFSLFSLSFSSPLSQLSFLRALFFLLSLSLYPVCLSLRRMRTHYAFEQIHLSSILLIKRICLQLTHKQVHTHTHTQTHEHARAHKHAHTKTQTRIIFARLKGACRVHGCSV